MTPLKVPNVGRALLSGFLTASSTQKLGQECPSYVVSLASHFQQFK